MTLTSNYKNKKNCFTGKLKRGFWLLLLLIWNGSNLYAGGQTSVDLSKGLQNMGFENIRFLQEERICYFSVENNIYRWNTYSIVQAMDFLAANVQDSSEIHLILLRKGNPYCLVKINSTVWKNFGNGKTDLQQFSEDLAVTWKTDDDWEKLKSIPPLERNTRKLDLVVYPQFSFKNTLLSKIYETQFNLAPAGEISFWRGNEFRSQVIFPIHNELGYEGDFIRPGFMTIAQELRLPRHWWVTINAGNFNHSRYGMKLNIWHPLRNENWNLEADIGLTGYSHFYDGKWTAGSLTTLTWSGYLSWFYSRFNLVLKGGASQYIYNDMGLFASCTRYFGESSIGFYAQFNEKNINGGFNAKIPFPFKRRFRHRRLRITIPNYFNLNYNSGTEPYYGQNFIASPIENQTNFITFTSEIKNSIIQLKKSTP